MNTQDQPESIEAKIVRLQDKILDQMSLVADIRNEHSRAIVWLNRLNENLERLKKEAEQARP